MKAYKLFSRKMFYNFEIKLDFKIIPHQTQHFIELKKSFLKSI
jgi:hypothetical protein